MPASIGCQHRLFSAQTREKKNEKKQTPKHLLSSYGVSYGSRTHGLQGHNLTL